MRVYAQASPVVKFALDLLHGGLWHAAQRVSDQVDAWAGVIVGARGGDVEEFAARGEGVAFVQGLCESFGRVGERDRL